MDFPWISHGFPMDFHGSLGSPGLGGGRASAHRSTVAERDARGGAATSAVAGVWALFSDMFGKK